MIYKLYIMKFKEDYNYRVEEEEFQKFYDEHNVKLIGEWVNSDNPKEVYFLTAYRDSDHHKQFVEAMKNNEEYSRLSSELQEMRESVSVINLVSREDYLSGK